MKQSYTQSRGGVGDNAEGKSKQQSGWSLRESLKEKMKSSPLRPCGWMKIERSGGWDENDSGWERGAGGRGLRWIRNMGPDAQINYSLHSSILSCQLPFIEAVRCPLRLARGGEASRREPRERKSSVKKTQKRGQAKKTKLLWWAGFGLPLQFANPGVKLYLRSRGASRGGRQIR